MANPPFVHPTHFKNPPFFKRGLVQAFMDARWHLMTESLGSDPVFRFLRSQKTEKPDLTPKGLPTDPRHDVHLRLGSFSAPRDNDVMITRLTQFWQSRKVLLSPQQPDFRQTSFPSFPLFRGQTSFSGAMT